jgi:hypothetical protein
MNWIWKGEGRRRETADSNYALTLIDTVADELNFKMEKEDEEKQLIHAILIWHFSTLKGLSNDS